MHRPVELEEPAQIDAVGAMAMRPMVVAAPPVRNTGRGATTATMVAMVAALLSG